MKLKMDTIGSGQIFNNIDAIALLHDVANSLNGAHISTADDIVEPLRVMGFTDEDCGLAMPIRTPCNTFEMSMQLRWLAGKLLDAVTRYDVWDISQWLRLVDVYAPQNYSE